MTGGTGFFFVAVGQQAGGSHRELGTSPAWAWRSQEDRAEGLEGEVSLAWADLRKDRVVVEVWGCAPT